MVNCLRNLLFLLNLVIYQTFILVVLSCFALIIFIIVLLTFDNQAVSYRFGTHMLLS
jgi:hypothetical protein